MKLGSMFISNCNITLHVSDAFFVHPQEYIKTVVAASMYVMRRGEVSNKGVKGRWLPHYVILCLGLLNTI
jgi:hypothetical protein